MTLRKAISKLTPRPILDAYRRRREERRMAFYAGKSTLEIFSHIYQSGGWGKSRDPSMPFYSGRGSHEGRVVDAYVDAIQQFLRTFRERPDVVDVGCGDFSVGRRLRTLCAAYTAVDIVPEVIAFNQRTFRDLEVTFRVADVTQDELPRADIAFVRQVFQHLSNRQVMDALDHLRSRYRCLIVTEHLPDSDAFPPNLDKPTGPNIRLSIGSGIDLAKAPFRLSALEVKVLCEVREPGALFRTTLYRLA